MVITNVNQVVYQGDGVTTAFPFTFRIIDETDIKLLLLDSDGTETDIDSDYYVDTTNNTVYYPPYYVDADNAVHFPEFAPGQEPPMAEQPPVLAEGQKLVIYRKLPITQEKDLGDKWPFYVIELGLDKLTMILQDIWDWLGRCLCVSKGQAYEAGDDFDPTIPLEADEVICGNANGTGFEAREALMEVNGHWDGEGRQIKGVADPTSEQDAVTKKYADTRMDNNFMKLQADGTGWESRNLPIRNVAGPALVKDAANKDYVDRILSGYAGQGDRFVFFDNVEQMKLAKPVPSQMAVTLGYWDVNDGGAGVYTIRDKGTDTPDGGSIIEIPGTDYVAELITDGTVNVKQFGAIGNFDSDTNVGHDDTDAIQRLFDSLPQDCRHLLVYFPPGIYCVTDTINIDDKYFLSVKCDGDIYNKSDVNSKPTFNLTNVDYSVFSGFTFFSGINYCFNVGVGCGQVNINNLTLNNVNNYGVNVDYTDGKPGYLQIENVISVYSYGLVKDICPNARGHGVEIIVKNVKFSYSGTIPDKTTYPAFMYFRNIHDIQISGLMGISNSNVIKMERDCNGQISRVNCTSTWAATIEDDIYERHETILLQDEDLVNAKLIMDNIFIWNLTTDDVDGINMGERSTVQMSNFEISGCTNAIVFKGQNTAVLTNGNLHDNTNDLALTEMKTVYVSVKTILNFNSVVFNSPVAFYSDVPQGYKQAVSMFFANCNFKKQVAKFTVYDQPALAEMTGCYFEKNDGGGNTMTFFRDNHRLASLPTKGTYKKGYKIINSSPSAGGNIGWVCTTTGIATAGTWSANTAYNVGDTVYFPTPNIRAICMKAGTSGSTQPATSTTELFADGSILWAQGGYNTAVFKAYGTIEA